MDSIAGTIDWIPWNEEKTLVGTGGVPEIPGIRTHVRWSGVGPEGWFHLVAVDRNGRRFHNGYSLEFQHPGRHQRVTRYAVALDDLDHFVVEPLGEEVTFFFEAVDLPSGDDGFQTPPTFKLSISGKEVNKQLASFGAPSIKVMSQERRYCGIAVGSEGWDAIFELDSCRDDSSSEGGTVLVYSRGLNLKSWDLTLLDQGGNEVRAGKTSGWGGHTGAEWLKSKGMDSPLTAVDSVVLSPDKEE